ncbi:MAG: TonB-dependent receptor [Gemmatimonadetes bacterium]|jgi:outer membrane receptor for ferrienterochelin and colicins|nr:TonB-dependent receptor [Gemmatimonadota bacterium]
MRRDSRRFPTGMMAIRAAALFICLAITSSAQAQTGQLVGTVQGVDGVTLAQAGLRLMGPNLPGGITGTLTDAKGSYVFEKIPVGTYSLKATFVGHHEGLRSDVVISAGRTTEVSLSLAEDPLQLGEIVISASRAAESIIEASASISRVEAADVQRDVVSSSYMGIVKNTKGIDHFQSSILEERVNARGFNSALSYRMLVLVDGRVSSMPSVGLPVNIQVPVADVDIESVEVIVGPGSALYGPDATSGVISMTTKDPRQYPGTQVSLAGGSRSTARGSFRHAGHRQQWAWKVSGAYHRAHDYERIDTYSSADGSVSQTDDPNFDADSMRGQIGLYYDPSADTRLALNIGGSLTNTLGVTSLGRIQAEDMKYNFQHVTYTTPRVYLGVYRSADDFGSTHMLATKAQAMLAGLPKAAAKDRAILSGHSAMWEAEARYRFELPKLHDTQFDIGANVRQFRPETDGLLLNDADRTIRLEQTGVYAQSRTDLTQSLRLVLAARLDDHEVYGSKVSPKAALIYHPRDDMSFRATYNQAYQSPSLGNQDILVRVSDIVAARGNGAGFQFVNLSGGPLPERYVDGIPKLEPEDNTTFEVGLRGVIANRVMVDASGYRSRYRNFISPVTPINDLANGIVVLDEKGNPRPEVTLTYLNFGEQTVTGFDVTANTYLNRHIGARAGLSLMNTGDLKGAGGFDQPFNTPEAIYTLGLSARDQFVAGSTADIALRHVTEFDFVSGVYNGTVSAYTVVDLNAGYILSHGVTARLTVKNLFGNRHREFIGGPRIGRMIVTQLDYSL